MDEFEKKLPMLSAEREDIKPILGMDWQRDLNRTIQRVEKSTTPTNQSEKDEIKTQFENLFNANQTVKDTKIKYN